MPGTTRTCRTPGSFRISSTLAETTLPPNTGHFSITAWSMPGSVKSMLNTGFPVTMAGTSAPILDWPMMVKAFGSFRRTLSSSGGVTFVIAGASCP